MSVRVRIAPSPTGFLHFGTARTALFNWLFARKESGRFLLRIEDTDIARNKPEYDADIFEQLKWLQLVPDEVYRQSECNDAHAQALRTLIDKGAAYESREPSKYDPSTSVTVVRLRNPNTTITFTDVVHGDISFDTTELKDFVIARALKDPLYHFAVVVDDEAMGITHVIRGEDHISNTPRHILIQEALGYKRPVYAHIPLILAPDRTKMSKRKHDTAIRSYRDKGYLSDALINFLALLGWNPGTAQEIFSRNELIAAFSLLHIQKSGAIFNPEKLRWFNREYLLAMPVMHFTEEAFRILQERFPDVRDVTLLLRIALHLRERISVWEDIRTLASEGEFDYFISEPRVEKTLIPEKKSSAEAARVHLMCIGETLSPMSENLFTAESIKQAVWDYATREGRGVVLWPFRYALTGKERSPDPFTVAGIIGKSATLGRVNTAIAALKS